MKCIHCSRNATYKDRKNSNGRCPGCKHPFAFEPYTDPLKVTDGQMNHAIEQVSGNGAVAYTTHHLWYEFNRRWRAQPGVHPLGWAGAATGTVGGGVAALITASIFPVIGGVAVGVVALVAGARANRRRGPGKPAGSPKVPYDQFLAKYYGPWRRVHGAGAREPLPPLNRATIQPSPAAPGDLATYSFDRALIVDRGEIAAMLVANNFHFENNCAILSIDGYPTGIRDTVMTMLHRNPRLEVFALHDASPAGCSLATRLREPGWFPDHAVKVIDLGLRPGHVQRLRLLTKTGRAHHVPAEARAGLSDDEVAWLEAGNVAELEAIRPARLLRSIFQGFTRARTAGADDATDSHVIWFHNSGSDIYAGDSFG